jgi:hypothetical protein
MSFRFCTQIIVILESVLYKIYKTLSNFPVATTILLEKDVINSQDKISAQLVSKTCYTQKRHFLSMFVYTKLMQYA